MIDSFFGDLYHTLRIKVGPSPSKKIESPLLLWKPFENDKKTF